MLTDTSWSIPALNGFPGGYMKDVAKWFIPEDFISMTKDKEDKRISFTESIVYTDKNVQKIFIREYWGIVTNSPRGVSGISMEKIAEFDGMTLAEKRDANKMSHKPENYIWAEFAKWYSDYEGK